MKVLLCVVLFTVAAFAEQQDYGAFPDYWSNDYDSIYDTIFKELVDSNENADLEPKETSQPAELDILALQEEKEWQNNAESKEFDVLADYQIEDNRSKVEKSNSGENEKAVDIQEIANAESIVEDPKSNEDDEELAVVPLEEPIENDAHEQSLEDKKETDISEVDNIENEVDSLSIPETNDNKDILEETKDILNEDTLQAFDDQQVESKDESPVDSEEHSDIDQIIAETNKLLRESDDSFEADDYNDSDDQEVEQGFFHDDNDEVDEDTPEKVYADLNADLDKLFETLDKLSDNNSEEDEQDDQDAADADNAYVDNVQDYEEKYGRPYNEGVALSWRDAEAHDAETNDSNQFDNPANENNDDTAVDDMRDDYENIEDSNLSAIFNEIAENQNQFKENVENEEPNPIQDLENSNSTVVENLADNKNDTVDTLAEENDLKETFDFEDKSGSFESDPNTDDEIDSALRQILTGQIDELQSYGNDALVDETQINNEDAVEFESIEANDTKVEENVEQKSVMVDELSSAELSDLMTQFAIAHSEDLDVHSENFANRVAPIHVTLSVDEPTVITSPNYPSPYPTNNIIDWIFEGPGTGIELNITNFAVNGAIGDYLLVKPGGIDETGNDGLIFSYRLNSERRYRFADVNRMFVRFESKPGWQFMNGFSFSVRMIWPLFAEEDLPAAEAVVDPPQETLTLNLAGLSLPKFAEIKNDFTELIADMANAYITDNAIDMGLNTTLEVTQITRTAVCNIRWPEYETCVEVTFGVPLQYEREDQEPRLNAEDLDTMWTSYIIKDQFAERLRALGITEYAIPNDRTVLMVWLVIAAGVVISMAMLAFALWRFSCFEDYTRMQAYSDTDSLKNEKRHLDLYPTPHQTLPPLYSENDYKWADDKYDDSTRVDMGGFANKSYIRDELFDLDSDEDVITTRDRKGVISPRDIYNV